MNLYFDNAATTRPKPSAVGEAMTHALIAAGNPGRGGHAAAMEATNLVWSAREQVARLFDASPENVIFTSNCTESINTVLRGLPLGSHVVVSDVEHNAVMRPLHLYGIPHTVAKTYPQNDRATVASFAAALRPDTRLVLCVHASNVTGQILPVRAIGQLAHEHGVWMAVDGAQSGGLLPLSLTTDPIDFLCLPGHKGLLGPSGTGVLIRSKNIPLIPLFTGGTGSFSLSSLPPDEWPERMESGTPNVPGIAALGAAVRWVYAHRDGLAAHEWAMAARLWEGLCRIRGVRVHTPCPCPKQTVPLVLFSVKGEASEQTAERLAAEGIAVRGGLHCAPSAHRKLGTLPDGAVRASVGAFTSAADVDFLCKKVHFR